MDAMTRIAVDGTGKRRAWQAWPARLLLAGLLASGAAAPAAADEPAAPAASVAGSRAVHGSTLDGRVALMARELALDAAQQGQLRKLLQAQREQVMALWDDEALPAPVRVSRTRAIGDHTADQIRAMLDDEQRKKYMQPRRRDAAVGVGGADVQAWMARSGQH